ncbi:MAG TPA: hypothetical protein VF546_09785 [Pyrinomonadaceae bacterium]|jgi:uncharacterized membrane protein
MKRSLKRAAAPLLAGFLAFAPPGTLLVPLLLLLGFMRRSWLLAGLAAGLGVLTVGGFLYLRRRARRGGPRQH